MREQFPAKIKKDEKGNHYLDFKRKTDVKYFLSKFKEGKNMIVSIEEKGERRSLRQNNALHLYFQFLADKLNESGLDMRKVLKNDIDMPWTLENVKNFLWRPIQKSLTKKTSTTKLKTNEVDKIFDVLNRHLGQRFGVHVPFPSEEDILMNY